VAKISSPMARAGSFSRYVLLAVCALSALLPGYIMVTGALKTQDEFLNSPWALPAHPSLTSFATSWSAGLPSWFVNTIIVTAGAVVGVMVLSALAAWGFAYWQFKGRETLLGVIVSLMVVPPVVLLIPLFQFGAQLGWISTFRIVILIYIGLMLPFSIYLLANFFSAIPASLLEAAQIDGASTGAIFRRIVLPLSGPPIATLAVVNILWAWNELLLALVFLQDPEKHTLMVGIASFRGRYSLDIPTVMAGLTLVTLPLVVAYLVGQRFFIQGLTAGGIKGE
jgi:ABC-type glycerol-3-phosphate transport system permease component